MNPAARVLNWAAQQPIAADATDIQSGDQVGVETDNGWGVGGLCFGGVPKVPMLYIHQDGLTRDEAHMIVSAGNAARRAADQRERTPTP